MTVVFIEKKCCVIFQDMTLLEGPGISFHVYDKGSRLFSVPLTVRKDEIEFSIYIKQS